MPAEKSPYPRQGSPLTWRLRAPVRAHLEARAARHARSLAGEVEVLVDLGLSIEERSGGDALFEAHLAAGAAARAARDVIGTDPSPQEPMIDAIRADIVRRITESVFCDVTTDRWLNIDKASFVLQRLSGSALGGELRRHPKPEVQEASSYLRELLSDPVLPFVLGREADRVVQAIGVLDAAMKAERGAWPGSASGMPERPEWVIGPPVRSWSSLSALAKACLYHALVDVCAYALMRAASSHSQGTEDSPGHRGWATARALRSTALDLIGGAGEFRGSTIWSLSDVFYAIDGIETAIADAAAGKPPAGVIFQFVAARRGRIRQNIEGLYDLIARCAPDVARETEADAPADRPET